LPHSLQLTMASICSTVGDWMDSKQKRALGIRDKSARAKVEPAHKRLVAH